MSAQFKAAASYQKLTKRIQQQIARARDREQYSVTVYRFDDDSPEAWDRLLMEFEELDYVSVFRVGVAEAKITWNAAEAEAAS
ncbi:DUF1654 domain-containing protein [Salinicola salarius]|uniref:DUF1654 domain-containing protein n=1 Tax=Salinicola salarius TaxID=430457 RepID=UPI0023E44357|nr:DUF1654 domain-containing protein [Salinicola salarius]MDF3917536.1 DUF1654 domain-containing protein [Salinicola salarius]